MKKKVLTLVLVCMIVVIDQLSKYLVNRYIELHHSLVIIKDFFKFTNSHNTGAAYGILSGKIWILVLISCFVFIYLVKEMLKNNDKKLQISYSMILGGLVGNLIDRVVLGYVRDFISFTFFEYEAAIFNISDMFIFLGVVFMFFIFLKEDYEKNRSRRE